MPNKVVIDCDVGVDDALALILAFHSPELEVKAITGVNGNVPLNLVFQNIRKVLSLIKPQQKPHIARGADQPLKGKTVHAHSVHGQDGLGGAKIKCEGGETWWQNYPGHASELIPEMAHQYPDEITLVAVGPLTNLALSLKQDPIGMKKLKELVIMGGAVRTRGNITPYAEFNIYSDPLAAQIVFESGLPITLVPLDVTHQVFLIPDWMEEQVKPLNTPFSNFLIEATGYDIETHRFRNRESIFLHDPLAVAAVIEPKLVKTERLSLQVDTDEGEYYGRIIEVNPVRNTINSSRLQPPIEAEIQSGQTPGLFNGVKDGPKIDVCLGVDAERFLELFVSRLRWTGISTISPSPLAGEGGGEGENSQSTPSSILPHRGGR